MVLITFCVLFAFISCGEHEHEFSKWKTTANPTCTVQGTQTRTCSSCGFVEYSQIALQGHTEVIDPAIKPTCTEKGKSSGSHCSTCNVTIKPQTDIPAKGHSPVVDSAIAPTCTVEGRGEGTHCEICGVIIVEQQIIEATGHDFDEGVIIEKANCIEDGTKKYTCRTASCLYTYTDTYSLTKFSATELYNMAVKYVGEITTYNKSGSEYALGTGFVISSDGKIVTNYHVIEGAYSASITINGKTYKIKSILAYDANIDLAILKIEANNLSFANICKQNVNVGNVVYAIGSSRGMTNTYSQGIITYANREVDGVSHVQHDASITHGNSGGPLINEYGEVVGINTWGISDSQNLNFAVFSAELDNLVYGTPLSFSEFYLKECSVFDRMKNYIIENGSYNINDNYYKLTLGTSYSYDYSNKYTRLAFYYVDDDEITIDLIIDDGDNWVYFTIDEDIDGSYAWNYFDENDYKMSGTIYASTYDSDTLLGYSYNNISSSSLRTSARKLASAMVSLSCSWLDKDFANIGVTAEDLYFYAY